MANVLLDDQHRICAISEDYDLGEGQFSFELPEDFDFTRITDYKIINGEIVEEESEETKRKKMAEALYNLQKTDYVALKLAETLARGEDCSDLMVKYDDVLKKRAEWRAIADDVSGDRLNE